MLQIKPVKTMYRGDTPGQEVRNSQCLTLRTNLVRLTIVMINTPNASMVTLSGRFAGPGDACGSTGDVVCSMLPRWVSYPMLRVIFPRCSPCARRSWAEAASLSG